MNYAPTEASSSALTPERPGIYEVMVPVFLRVAIPAEDDLEAETSAVAFVRSLSPVESGGATVNFSAVISPLVEKTPA